MGDTGAPGTCLFFQDVTLPAGVNQGTLSYSAGYNFQDFGAGPAGCSASIAITDTANVPIATGYTQVAAALNDPMVARAPIVFSTTPGGTVRVLLTETSCAGGPVGLVADNLILSVGSAVPALDDWAKIVLALLLAGMRHAQLENPQPQLRSGHGPRNPLPQDRRSRSPAVGRGRASPQPGPGRGARPPQGGRASTTSTPITAAACIRCRCPRASAPRRAGVVEAVGPGVTEFKVGRSRGLRATARSARIRELQGASGRPRW